MSAKPPVATPVTTPPKSPGPPHPPTAAQIRALAEQIGALQAKILTLETRIDAARNFACMTWRQSKDFDWILLLKIFEEPQ